MQNILPYAFYKTLSGQAHREKVQTGSWRDYASEGEYKAFPYIIEIEVLLAFTSNEVVSFLFTRLVRETDSIRFSDSRVFAREQCAR